MDGSAAPRDDREVIERLVQILDTGELDKLGDVLQPDFVEEIPQSGERVRGVENYRQIIANYPGGWEQAYVRQPQVVGSEPRYVMTPTFNLVKLEGSGDTLTGYALFRYPDGSEWYAIMIATFKDHKIIRSVDFFAPAFDPPPWRSQWVELP